MSTKIEGRYGGQGGRLVFRDPYNSHETALPIADVVFYDDFLGQAIDTTHNWTAKDTGDATETLLEDGAAGIVALHLAVTGEEEEAGLYQNDKLWVRLDHAPVFECRVSPHVLPTLLTEMYFGLCDSYVKGELAAADNGPLTHICFMLDGSGAVTIHTDDTANDNDAVATGVTLVADEWAVFRIDCSDPTNVLFFINGNRVASGTTFDVSTDADQELQPYFMVYKSAGAGLGDLYVDYCRVWQNRA